MSTDLTKEEAEEINRVMKEVQDLQKAWIEGLASLEDIPELHRQKLERLKELLAKRTK